MAVPSRNPAPFISNYSSIFYALDNEFLLVLAVASGLKHDLTMLGNRPFTASAGARPACAGNKFTACVEYKMQ